MDASQVAEVDLRTLEVSYHALEWLGAESIAVSGSDTGDGRYLPAGLHVVDTRGWTLRDLDEDATGFELADGLLLATGWHWDASRQLNMGSGVKAYSTDGARRFELFPGEHAWLAEVYRRRAYVGVASAQDRLRVVDLASGTVTG